MHLNKSIPRIMKTPVMKWFVMCLTISFLLYFLPNVLIPVRNARFTAWREAGDGPYTEGGGGGGDGGRLWATMSATNLNGPKKAEANGPQDNKHEPQAAGEEMQKKKTKNKNKKNENKGSICRPATPPFSPPPLVPQNSPATPYVIMNAQGELGNQMCQYFAAYLLRHFFGIKVSIGKQMKDSLTKYFQNITIPVRVKSNEERITFETLYQLLYNAGMREAASNGGVVKGPLLKKSYYIYSFPSPRDLFMHHRSLARRVLVFKDEVLSHAKRNLAQALSYLNRTIEDDSTTLVTVHVRRTDYVKFVIDHYNITTLTPVYYKRAFDFFRHKVYRPVFVVVSDDLQWCRENLPADDVVIAGSPFAGVDQALLTLGDHTITSYGTFSFMGALLGEGHFTHPLTKKGWYNVYSCLLSLDVHFISRD